MLVNRRNAYERRCETYSPLCCAWGAADRVLISEPFWQSMAMTGLVLRIMLLAMDQCIGLTVIAAKHALYPHVSAKN